MTNPIVDETDRGDLLADIDRALGPALDQVLRRYVLGPSVREVREIRGDIIEAIGDIIIGEVFVPFIPRYEP